MNCSKTNNSIPFHVTLSLPQFLVSLIRLNFTFFVCRRICVILTPPIFFASYIFFLSFSVIRNLHKLCLSLLCVCLCRSISNNGRRDGSTPAAWLRDLQRLPHLFPAAIRQTHLSYYTAPAQAHTAMREWESERVRERSLEAVAAPGARRSAPSHLNLFKHEWHIAIKNTPNSRLFTNQEAGPAYQQDKRRNNAKLAKWMGRLPKGRNNKKVPSQRYMTDES